MDTACVVEAAATALLPGPVLSTVTAGAVALLADDTPVARALLGRLAEGASAAVVLPGDHGLRATPSDDGWTVTGTSTATLGLCSAQVLIVAATTVGGTILVRARSVPQRGRHRCPRRHRQDDRRRCVAARRVCLRRGFGALRYRRRAGTLPGSGADRQCRIGSRPVGGRRGDSAPEDPRAVRQAHRHIPGAAAQGGHAVGQQRAGDVSCLGCGARRRRAAEPTSARCGRGRGHGHRPRRNWCSMRSRCSVRSASPGSTTCTSTGVAPSAWPRRSAPPHRWARQLGELTGTHRATSALNLGDAEKEFRAAWPPRWMRRWPCAMTARAGRATTRLRNRAAAHADRRRGSHRTALAAAVGSRCQSVAAAHHQRGVRQAARPGAALVGYRRVDPAHVVAPRRPMCRSGSSHRRSVASWRGASCSANPVRARTSRADHPGDQGRRRLAHQRTQDLDVLRATADLGALLARTDPAAAKHRGIGLLHPRHACRGIEIQPIRHASGDRTSTRCS